jgi:alpha-tubulin suppressor-like RCC1 family protein
MSAGAVKCWGRYAGLLTTSGAPLKSLVPADVAGLESGVVALASGRLHACALTSRGGVNCWGSNVEGQLGTGARTRYGSSGPVDVVGLASGVIAIAAGDGQSCALTSAGGVQCWGANSFGQLGNGTAIRSAVPVDVLGLASGVIAITAGGLHSCAITAGGGVKCWGRNVAGELGDGSTIDSTVPVDVQGLASGVTAITAGVLHTCARTGGGVKCWGDNGSSRSGLGPNVRNSTVPMEVVGLGGPVLDVEAGDGHTCVLTSVGGVQCWGLNYAGQLGNGTSISSSRPVDVDFTPRPTIVNGSAVGLTQTGPFSTPTKVTPHGTFITWQAQPVPPMLAGERLDVWIATKSTWSSGWSSFSLFATSVVDDAGYAHFAFRSPIAQWVSIRFSFAGNAEFPAVTSLARPVRYT